MSMAQFAMVEELAFLIKDNLPCKHLVLTMEEALVNFLQDDTSSDGILELEPMNSYSRLLLHRLADIFGFAHESVGEGDNRHLILEKRPETSIPPILVSDLLWQYDEPQPPSTSYQLLKREEASPVLKTNRASLQQSLEEKELAYLAARERIFSMDLDEVKEPVRQRARNVPVVARRMIAHALGQRIHPKNQEALPVKGMADREFKDELRDCHKNDTNSNLMQDSRESTGLSRKLDSDTSSLPERNAPQKQAVKNLTTISQNTRSGNVLNKDHLNKERMGAAKRMFAHALGMQTGTTGSITSRESNETNTEQG